MMDDNQPPSPDSLVVYEGNWPGNVSSDAKYSIQVEEGKYVVGTKYRFDKRETWYPTTDGHPKLVEMVNRIKVAINDAKGGPFYINEFKQVLVPVGSLVVYYYAGDYSTPLVFEIDGHRLSGRATALDGTPLGPGMKWEGIHQGIPYVLTADGRDIYYEKRISPKRTRKYCLSDYVGEDRARELAAKIRRVKGFEGGRFYINEYRQLFTGMPYTYIGEQGDGDPWFPRPHSTPPEPTGR
jgi:hypothetical protein